MRSAQVNSVREWNAKFPADRLPHIVVVVNEFAQFRAADALQNSQERKGRQAVVARWQEIGRTGRSVGVHVIACTQRPDAETITPQLKAQFPGKVAFFCADDMNSRVILDESAAAALPPPRLTREGTVWKGKTSDLVESQVPYLSDEEGRAPALGLRRHTFPQPPHRQRTGEPGGPGQGRGRWSARAGRRPVGTRAEGPVSGGAAGLDRGWKVPQPLAREVVADFTGG